MAFTPSSMNGPVRNLVRQLCKMGRADSVGVRKVVLVVEMDKPVKLFIERFADFSEAPESLVEVPIEAEEKPVTVDMAGDIKIG
jgi:hypothetical protein